MAIRSPEGESARKLNSQESQIVSTGLDEAGIFDMGLPGDVLGVPGRVIDSLVKPVDVQKLLLDQLRGQNAELNDEDGFVGGPRGNLSSVSPRKS